MGLVKNLYFLNRSKYSFRPYAYGGLSGEKQIAVPRNGRGSSYILKGNSRECACNEFMGLRLAKMLGANVPDTYLVEPKENMYEVAIEYLEPMPKPDFDRVKVEKDLLHEYVYGFIAHCLLKDRDAIDFLFSNNMIYTFDFGDAFGIDDFSIGIMENASEFASILPAHFYQNLLRTALSIILKPYTPMNLWLTTCRYVTRPISTLLLRICVPVFLQFQRKKSKACSMRWESNTRLLSSTILRDSSTKCGNSVKNKLFAPKIER